MNSTNYISGIKFEDFTPFSYTFNFIPNFYEMVSTGVSRLLFWCSPFTIFLTVRAIGIYAFNRSIDFSVNFYMRLITLIHIVTEFFKRFPKKFYSTASIKMIILFAFVFDASLYSCKDFIKACTSKTVSYVISRHGYIILMLSLNSKLR